MPRAKPVLPKRSASPRAPRVREPHASGAGMIVAVGASAGGLEAFMELLSVIPEKSGLAFVLVQHLNPRHESLLADILDKGAAVPVQQVVDGMRIERDHVYVIPPDREMTVANGILTLEPRARVFPHRPLDNFFRSLAVDQENRAVGVVLSGNDTDGSAGLRAIRDSGGITFAQDPGSAKFDVMPRSAAPSADLILPPREIGIQLVRLAQKYDGRVLLHPSLRTDGAETEAFGQILDLLRQQFQTDFRLFKQSSVHRRVMRRVLLGGFEGMLGYAAWLASNPADLEPLYRDLLIGVTSFFRVGAQFDELKARVYPEIAKGKTAADTIRFWVAGCSTGEEVYSLAITLLEFLGDGPDVPRVLIYGTDINERALEIARAGFYSRKAVANVSPERLERFFSTTSAGYKIAKRVRELCVFARHDITRDPPYSRIDLATCCNVLIYFDETLQKKAIALLHYALVAGGFLMLGTSENLRGSGNLFRPSGSSPLIYRKVTPERREPGDFAPAAKPIRAARPAASRSPGPDAHDRADSYLLTHVAPCSVLVNDQMEIVRSRGNVNDFLSLAAGEATLNLFRLIRHPELLAKLRPAMRKAVRDSVPVVSEDIMVSEGGRSRRIRFEIVPYTAGADLYWVLFHPAGAVPRARKGRSSKPAAAEESELEVLRQALAAVVEDRERVAGEAAAAAEEAQSSDEELRSTNEELETAKEELQSANDELSLLNEELRTRNTMLTTINDDLENLFALEIPIVFVGPDARMRRFNQAARLLLGLDPGFAGRSLTTAKSAAIDVEFLDRLVSDVIVSRVESDVEMQEKSGRWRVARIRPYQTSEGRFEGAIVSLVDIDALKRSVVAAENAARAAQMLSEASELLASSLDYEKTIDSLTQLSTEEFCDWCAVDLVNEDGSIRHLTVRHQNPVMRELASEFQRVAFREPDGAPGAPEALRLGTSVLVPDLGESPLSRMPRDRKLAQLLGALGVKSLISVPIVVRGSVLGTTTFASAHRSFEGPDLQFAEELTRRAAAAIDTALLFREAEAANHYKDAFLGTVAHELRTPLTSILGWVQLAAKVPDLEAEALRRIDESANLLRVFIEDLLDVSRIREHKLRMSFAPVDFVALIRSADEMIGLTAKNKEVQMAMEIPNTPVMLMGDSVRLLQVVWNLLSNAVKYTPAGGTVRVQLTGDEREVQLSVRDSGIGISKEFLPHVFELFRQETMEGQHATGLGIGLALVSSIVTLHGGTVHAESPGLGHGSTFIVRLPPAAAEPPEE